MVTNLKISPETEVFYPGEDNEPLAETHEHLLAIINTFQGNKDNDYLIKKSLYEQLSVEEYWLFDPRGEWVPEQILGCRLQPEGFYRKITNNYSEVLNLNLVPEGSLLTFYAIDSGEKLLIPDELWQALQGETQARQAAQRKAEEAEQRAMELEAMLDRYRNQFGDLPNT